MVKKWIITTAAALVFNISQAAFLHNEYSYLQDITFELYTDDVPAYKVPEQIKSIEESLMFEILHATWKDKHWVAYTLNKNLLGTFKVGQPALLDEGGTKRMYFVASFPGSVGGLDLYVSEYADGKWGKPKNLGKAINTEKNESNPGLLNDHTLTYSSGGIIKKLNLNTFKVVDLEESGNSNTSEKNDTKKNNSAPIAAIGDNSTAAPANTNSNSTSDDYGAIGDNSTAMPANTNTNEMKKSKSYEAPASPPPPVAEQRAATNTMGNASNANTNSGYTPSADITFLGTKSREEMLSKYKAAIQLGAFTNPPKPEAFAQLAKFGKIVSYKNDKGINVVWITGFSSHAAADAVLPQVKAVAGFENAYVTGK